MDYEIRVVCFKISSCVRQINITPAEIETYRAVFVLQQSWQRVKRYPTSDNKKRRHCVHVRPEINAACNLCRNKLTRLQCYRIA